ncbi:acyltransferase domain-containing protein [Lacrimispora brassicae]
MIRHNIFSEDIQKAVASASAVFRSYPFFMSNYIWCKELLLKRKDPEHAAEAVELGIRHAKMLDLDAYLLPVVYIDWMLPEAFEEYKNQGIPELVFLESMKDIEIWIKVYRRYHGDKVGLDQIEWVFRSISGKVRRFGSLQFEEVTYEFPFLIFKNRQTGEYKALACPGLKVDQDGYFSGTNGRNYNRESETSVSVLNETVTGFSPDLKQGVLKMEKAVTLDLSDWELKLAPGEKTAAVHIPEGADLSPDKIDSALETAKEYYTGSLLVCDSWLLDPHLEFILPEKSRIISFMERFYKMPLKAERPQILERVLGFNCSMEKLENYPCSTSLQISLKKYLLKGKEMFTTAGFLPWK